MIMKGQGLPINTMIIMILSVVVLVIIIALLSSSISASTPQISAQAAWNEACGKWRKFNCSGVEFDDHIKISWQGEYKTVQEICLLAYGSDDYEFCRSMCCGS